MPICLFINAKVPFNSSTPGSTTSMHGIRDPFFIARNFANEGVKIRRNHSNLLQAVYISVLSILPHWFPWNGRASGSL